MRKSCAKEWPCKVNWQSRITEVHPISYPLAIFTVAFRGTWHNWGNLSAIEAAKNEEELPESNSTTIGRPWIIPWNRMVRWLCDPILASWDKANINYTSESLASSVDCSMLKKSHTSCIACNDTVATHLWPLIHFSAQTSHKPLARR